MASKKTHVIETDLYQLTQENMTEKLMEHFAEVREYVKAINPKNVRIVTRIKELNPNVSVMISDIEDLKKYMEE